MGAPWRPRGPDDLDEDGRARIRYQVLASLRNRPPTLADRAYDAVAMLALPAPHLVRALVAALVVVSIVGTATVAGADALPEEPLYGVKVAGEQVRLALARTPEDRAAVELSMAEHRLAEAARLALVGREPAVIVATSAYGAHLASAAAELASVERASSGGPVIRQLKDRLAEQQRRAADLAAHLAADPATAPAAPLFQTVASFAPALPSGASLAEGIAEHAASVAGQLATVAERLAEAAEAKEQDEDDGDDDSAAERPAPAPQPARATAEPKRRSDAGPAVGTTGRSVPTATPAATPKRTERPAATPREDGAKRAAATERPKPAAKATPDPKKVHEAEAAREAAEKAKHEAEKAREAAEKAKERAKQTAPPKPAKR